MKLYGFGQSRSFRALWALEESGLEYEYIPVEFGSEAGPHGSRSSEYMALNTQGKVPTLIDGSLILTESAAIVNHIGRRAPESGLVPNGDLTIQAHYDQVMFFILSDLEQPLWSNGKHRFALPEPQRIPAMLETATWEFAKAQQALHQYLDDREYVVGEHFTAVDIVLAQTINWAERFKFDVDQKFLAYRDNHYSRPAARKALELIS